METGETDNQDENGAQRVDREPLYSTEEMNFFPEPDEEPEVTESKSSFISDLLILIYRTVKMYIVSTTVAMLTDNLLHFDRVTVLGASRCAAAVEPVQFDGTDWCVI